MTDPGPEPTPARTQLNTLNILLRELQTEVQELSGRLPESHPAEHEWLRDTMERLVRRHNEAPDPFHETDLDADERAQREHDLRVWLRDILSHYDVGQHLNRKPCWWDGHTDLRWHVQATWLAWIGAYRADNRRHDYPAVWHERHLPALDAAAKAVLGPPEESHCEKHPPPRPGSRR